MPMATDSTAIRWIMSVDCVLGVLHRSRVNFEWIAIRTERDWLHRNDMINTHTQTHTFHDFKYRVHGSMALKLFYAIYYYYYCLFVSFASNVVAIQFFFFFSLLMLCACSLQYSTKLKSIYCVCVCVLYGENGKEWANESGNRRREWERERAPE